MSTKYTFAIGRILGCALLVLGLMAGEAVAQVEDTTGQAMEQDPAVAEQQTLSDEVILHVFITSNRGEIVTSESVSTPEMMEETETREDPETMEYPETREDPETVEDTARVETDTAAVGGGETTVGREDEEEALSDPVHAFAQRMMREHGDILQQAEALALELNIEPEPNLLSTMLEETAEGITEELRALPSEEERHREYMQAQISMHQQTLDLLEHTLIPNTENEELVNLLEDARSTVEQHLDQALSIYQEMAPGTS